jgi:hypothetical protein
LDKPRPPNAQAMTCRAGTDTTNATINRRRRTSRSPSLSSASTRPVLGSAQCASEPSAERAKAAKDPTWIRSMAPVRSDSWRGLRPVDVFAGDFLSLREGVQPSLRDCDGVCPRVTDCNGTPVVHFAPLRERMHEPVHRRIPMLEVFVCKTSIPDFRA